MSPLDLEVPEPRCNFQHEAHVRDVNAQSLEQPRIVSNLKAAHATATGSERPVALQEEGIERVGARRLPQAAWFNRAPELHRTSGLDRRIERPVLEVECVRQLAE